MRRRPSDSTRAALNWTGQLNLAVMRVSPIIRRHFPSRANDKFLSQLLSPRQARFRGRAPERLLMPHARDFSRFLLVALSTVAVDGCSGLLRDYNYWNPGDARRQK